MRQASQPSGQSDPKWPCQRCTFHNPITAAVCEMCKSPRQSSHQGGASQSGEATLAKQEKEASVDGQVTAEAARRDAVERQAARAASIDAPIPGLGVEVDAPAALEGELLQLRSQSRTLLLSLFLLPVRFLSSLPRCKCLRCSVRSALEGRDGSHPTL